MLSPKRVKFRKMFKGRMKGLSQRGNTVAFGTFGLQALEPGWVTSRQIEAARVALTRHIKRGGKVWIRIFPDKPITKKPAETRMGKGKGNPEGWVGVVKPGRVLFEIEGISQDLAKKARALAAAKLPVRPRFLRRGAACAEAAGAMQRHRGLARGRDPSEDGMEPGCCRDPEELRDDQLADALATAVAPDVHRILDARPVGGALFVRRQRTEPDDLAALVERIG